MPKSALFKQELIEKVNDAEYGLDPDVRASLKQAIEKLKPKMDAEFYGLVEEVAEESEPVEAPESEEQSQEQEQSWTIKQILQYLKPLW